MPDNHNQQAQEQAFVTCRECNRQMEAPQPQFDVVNGRFHAVVIVSVDRLHCPNCGAIWQQFISPEGTSVNVTIRRVKSDPKAPLVILPKSDLMM